MRIITLLAYLAGIPAISHGLVENYDLISTIRSMPNSEITRDVLPQGKEDLALEALRKIGAMEELFRLNDQPTIDTFFLKWRQKRGLDWRMVQQLERCTAPYVLDELAPSLYESPDEELRWAQGGYYSDAGYPRLTAELMTGILRSAPEIPEKVQESFDHSGRIYSAAALREWWEANQDALRKERYSDLKAIDYENLQEYLGQSSSSESRIGQESVTGSPSDPATSVPKHLAEDGNEQEIESQSTATHNGIRIVGLLVVLVTLSVCMLRGFQKKIRVKG